ncbi:MAG: hypothetical protein ACRC30_06650 [Clostridium sp.]
MNKFNLTKLLKLILIGIFINMLIFFINKNSLSPLSNSLEDLIILSYGSLGTSVRELLSNIISNTVNCVFLTYIFCDYVIKDINMNGQYIFTRNPNRKKWLIFKYFNILIFILVYYLCIYLTFFSLSLAFGFQLYALKNIFILILPQFIISILITIFSILFTTQLSFKISSLYSFSIFYSCYIINLIALFFFKNNLLGIFFALSPFCTNILSWNSSINTLLSSNINSFSIAVININSFFICLLFVIFILLFIAFQIKSLKNKDIL